GASRGAGDGAAVHEASTERSDRTQNRDAIEQTIVAHLLRSAPLRYERERRRGRRPHHGMPTLYGNTTGLSPHATKTLERIYRRKVPLDHIATPELIKSLAEASHEAGRQVAALVHRSGEVDYVIVGDATRL